MKKLFTQLLFIAALTVCFGNKGFSQDAAATSATEELAKKLANPVASLISVPLQNNFDFGVGPNNGFKYTLNIQPVIPISIGANTNMITRVIMPVISQSDVYTKGTSQSGLGDVVASAFFSPKKPTAGGLIWGAGPVFLVPTGATGLTADKFGIGPTIVALKQKGPWTFGVLANQIWSVSGSGANNVNLFFVNPFVSRAFKTGFSYTVSSEDTQDWRTSTFNGALLGSIAQITKIGNQLISVGGGIKGNFGNATYRPDWGLRTTVVLLFPKK